MTDQDPKKQFLKWFEEAKKKEIPKAEASVLATATPEGVPSARVILFKGFDENNLLFFTNYESRKSREIFSNPRVALVFHWEPLGKQVRIEGTASKTSPEKSNEYWASRPRESQLSGAASHQSQIIENHNQLVEKVKELQEKYQTNPIPRPNFWGGFQITPDRYEFWIDDPTRLHQRFVYNFNKNGKWERDQLAP